MAKRVSIKGRGADLFLGEYRPDAEPDLQPEDESAAQTSAGPTRLPLRQPRMLAAPATPRTEDDLPEAPRPAPARRATSIRASTLASTDAPADEDVVEAIRRTLKTPGKEVLYVRLTAEEKAQIADIVYTYKRQHCRTSDTEVGRIAVSYLIADYRAHGEVSVLARVLAALQA